MDLQELIGMVEVPDSTLLLACKEFRKVWPCIVERRQGDLFDFIVRFYHGSTLIDGSAGA